MPFGLQPIHLVVIVIVALLIFGPKRLPQLGRWIARMFSELRRGARDMAEGFREETASQEQAGTRTADSPKSPRADPSQAEPGDGSSILHPEDGSAGNYCTNCGAGNALDARFCNKCGTRLPS